MSEPPPDPYYCWMCESCHTYDCPRLPGSGDCDGPDDGKVPARLAHITPGGNEVGTEYGAGL